ncbi:hypothetical protein V1517DRAFT_91299 [Lipomyces orientalis]|uniref:Uncharacterized protein n=1 Tax=Lipomyces orientalis TaxID=1233043 RepID=A0ACC3TRQ4_9ASCO
MSSLKSARLKKSWSKSSKNDNNEAIKSTKSSSTGLKLSASHSLPTPPSTASPISSQDNSSELSSISDGSGLSRRDTIHMKGRERTSSVRPVRSVLPDQLTSIPLVNGHNVPELPPKDVILTGSHTNCLQGNGQLAPMTTTQQAAPSYTVTPRLSSLKPPSPSPERVQARRSSPDSARMRYRNPFENYSKQPNAPEPMADDAAMCSPEDILQWYLFKSSRLELLKDYYHQKTSKIEQLESQLAVTSLEGARQMLDDSAYMSRFHLLDKNLAQFAFHWRAQWIKYPDWIEQFNLKQDSKLKKIQVRAHLTEWLVNEVFNKILHPGLKLEESLILKNIERNIIVNNDRKIGSEPKDNVVAWRTATLKARLDLNFLNQQGERDALKMTIHYQDHRRAILASFGEYFSTSLDTRLFGQDGSLNDSFMDGLDSIIEEVLTLISFMSLETRNITVYLIPPGSPYSSNRMRVPEDYYQPREGTEIGLSAFLGVKKEKDGQPTVLYQPEVYLKN